MTSLTLHLIVIVMLLEAASLSSATNAAQPRAVTKRTRGGAAVAPLGERNATVFLPSPSSTTTQAPTLRAPRQRRPQTTASIAASSSTTARLLSRNSGRSPTTTATTTTTAAAAGIRTPQRRRPLESHEISMEVSRAAAAAARSSRARQPRDTPLDNYERPLRAERSLNSSQEAAIAEQLQVERQLAKTQTTTTATSVAVSSTSARGKSQAMKTPRMIQRLMAGHIQNAQGHSSYEVSAVSSNSTSSSKSTVFQKRQQKQPMLSSSYRLAKRPPGPTKASSTEHIDTLVDEEKARKDDDEALLGDPDDFDNWDNGILRLSAGSGKEASASSAKKQGKPGKGGKEEEGKKTLADQVRDGKYGLIANELFHRTPKRPGVLSYARNPEVPLDNERNYGGLNEQDIWLAEDHLLVIKGGSLNEDDGARESWPPIDDYDAPTRQIKIPDNPVVPPPFPVQLDAQGPLQLIRDNKLTVVYPVANETIPVYITSTEANNASPERPAGHATHPAARTGALVVDKADDQPRYVYPAPYAPWLYANHSLENANPFLKSPRPITLPGLGPWLLNSLNGSLDAANGNSTNDFDEDDPTLYYPPAYSFVYKSNYSNPVPPGPLVPGIVLPPPPNQFARLEVNTAAPLHTSQRRPVSSTTTASRGSLTSTTSTSTPTPTSPAPPYRGTALPNLPKHSPKYNAIGYVPVATPVPPRQLHTPKSKPKYVERVPVPVAVPIPIYPINYQPTTRPRAKSNSTRKPAQTLLFVPTSVATTTTTPATMERNSDTLSKSHPIYYEYFESKQHSGIKPNVIEDFLESTGKTVMAKELSTRERHHKQPPASAAHDVVNITPKPLPSIHSEYDALGQLLRTNLIPQASYDVYDLPVISSEAGDASDYANDANLTQDNATSAGRFQPPDFDKKPFLPMVNYSADEHDRNAFKALVYSSNAQPSSDAYQLQRQRQMRVGKHQQLLDTSYGPHLYSTPQPAQDSYLPEQQDYGSQLLAPKLLLQRQRQLRVAKHQQHPQSSQLLEPQSYQSTPQPVPLDSYLARTPVQSQEQRHNQVEQGRVRPGRYQLVRPHFVRSGQLVAAAPYGYSNYPNISALAHAKPPAPPTPVALQFWQRPLVLPAPYKRKQQPPPSPPPYYVPNYPTAPASDALYRLMPVPQHKHWLQSSSGSGNSNNKKPLQSPAGEQQQAPYGQVESYAYGGGSGVPIGHSLAGDILVNYNTNNQFNPQAELVPHAQLGPPPVPPPLSYQAQSGQHGGALWTNRPARQLRAHEQT